MNKEMYTAKELINIGFEWVLDGGDIYLQQVDNPSDYINSSWRYAEFLFLDGDGEEVYKIVEGKVFEKYGKYDK